MTNIYNGWISKTNWTLVIGILVNVVNDLFPVIPVQYQAGITTLLSFLAMYFHVSGVNKAANTSAALGHAASGQ